MRFDMLQRLRDGVLLEDGVAKFTDIQEGNTDGANQWYYCVVMEGKNREVRRLWESQGIRISRLKRVRYGNVFIPSHVRAGQWVELSEDEINDLRETAGLERIRKQKFSAELKGRHERHQKKLRSAPARGKGGAGRRKK